MNFFKNNRVGSKVAVVAVLKDEAPYISEWIHHYLYFGFDGIFLGVNRTTDETTEIISKIQKNHEAVFWTSLDWLDDNDDSGFNVKMQEEGYAFLTEKVTASVEQYTHILYVDIDEFLLDKTFDFNIHDLVKDFEGVDAISFNWLNQPGDSGSFELPFKNRKIKPTCTVKTLISTASISKIQAFRPHVPKFKNKKKVRHVDASGAPFVEGRHEQILANVPDAKYAILHRLVRSQKEYLALLLKKNPNMDVPFKINRKGYETEAPETLDINPELLSRYWKSLEEFIIDNDITDLIKASQDKIGFEHPSKLFKMPKLIINHIDKLVHALKGTDVLTLEFIQGLASACEKFDDDDYATKYFKCSKMLKNENMNDAAHCMALLALKARPKGKVIQAWLETLEAERN